MTDNSSERALLAIFALLTGDFAVFNDAGLGLKVYKCDKCGFETRVNKT